MTRVGLTLPQLGAEVTPSIIRDFAHGAEQIGFASLWVQERLLRPLQPTTRYGKIGATHVPAIYDNVLSPIVLLSAAATQTNSIRLGSAVMVAGNHHPVQFAQSMASLDRLSSGRLDVGLGVGWSREEHRSSGVEFSSRGQRTDEFIDVIQKCWTHDTVSHQGEWFFVPDSHVGPKPMQQPHPPLLFGMLSTRGFDRVVAHAQGWLSSGISAERAASIWHRLNERRGTRPPLSIHHKLYLGSPDPQIESVSSIAELADSVQHCHDLGFTEVIIELNFSTKLAQRHRWAHAPEMLSRVLDATR